MATNWPANDERALLTLACCGEQLVTRVESYQDDTCIVHLPVHACLEPDRQAPDNVLSWFSTEHCWTRPVAISGMGGYPRAPLWLLEALGDGERWQRRDSVRVPANLDVKIYSADTELCEIPALDLSEGGLRCGLNSDQLQVLPPLFNVRFNIAGEQVRVPARVAWSASQEDGEFEATSGFEFQGVPASTADLIRSYVFCLQIEMRRRRLATR